MSTAILLAAGHSRRFGRDKPTFLLGGESLAQRCMRQASVAGIDRFVIVANEDNHRLLREQADALRPGQVTVRIQDGDEAPASALTGLAAADDDDVLLCCTNDLVPDDTFGRVMSADEGAPALTITTTRLKWVFTGGMLDLDGEGRLRKIIEKPPGGCPPGAAVNIFIHRYHGAAAISQLTSTLTRTRDYELTVNDLIEAGLATHMVHVDRWVGIKSVHDVQRAREEFADHLV
jgi:choline kinase